MLFSKRDTAEPNSFLLQVLDDSDRFLITRNIVVREIEKPPYAPQDVAAEENLPPSLRRSD